MGGVIIVCYNFRFCWAFVTEKRLNSVYREVLYLSAGYLNDKSAFLRSYISLKSKTNTNELLIC